MNRSKWVLLGILPLLLASCESSEDLDTVKLTFSSDATSSRVFAPDEVTVSKTLHSMRDDMLFNMPPMPSVGDVNVLVLPILIPTYENIDLDGDGINDNAKVLSDIQEAFFGSGENGESLASFYRKSSYGKLNITGTVASWFDLGYLGYSDPTEITSSVVYEILDEAVGEYKTSNRIDALTDFDKDNNGQIDAVWMIYSAPNYSNGGPTTDDSNYWAYTAWANQTEDGDINDPIPNLFGWASYDFMYTDYVDGVDAHTYIHETGHFLGLHDYYSTDSASVSYSPLGKLDMMDANVLDHNSYSKMILGWAKPYLVYGGGEVELPSSLNEDAFVVVMPDSAEISNEFDPFSEYLLVENFSLDLVGGSDADVRYGGYSYPSEGGIRLFHVDARPYLANSLTYEAELYTGQSIGANEGLILPITNSRNYDNYNYYFGLSMEVNLYDEIRLIESSGIDTFSSGGQQSSSSYFKAGDSFSLSTYDEFFADGLLNSGEACSITMEVE